MNFQIRASSLGATSSRGSASVKAFKADATKLEKQIDQLLERIDKTDKSSVFRAYEDKVTELQSQRLILLEKPDKPVGSKCTFDELFELSLKILSSPCRIWGFEWLHPQHTELKPTFSEHLSCCREQAI